MASVVFDIETVGIEWESLDDAQQGMDGYSVGPYYRAGRLREIAQYCRRDVEATARSPRQLLFNLRPLTFRPTETAAIACK